MTNNIRSKIWNLIRGGSFRGYLRTASGYPLTLSGCMAEYPVSLSVSGNTVQDGSAIQGCGDRTENGYKIPVTVSGRNLFNKKNYDYFPAYLAWSQSDKTKVIMAKSSQTYTFWIRCKANTKYTVSTNINNKIFMVAAFDNMPDYVSMSSNYTSSTGANSLTLTTSNTAQYLTFMVSGKKDDENYINSIMVEENPHASPYEPYYTPHTLPIYTDAPLYGNGDLCDTLELNAKNRMAIITRRFSLDDTGEIIEIAAPITTDISNKIDWNSIPRLWRGTAVLTSDTTVQPSKITAQYYADRPNEEVN